MDSKEEDGCIDSFAALSPAVVVVVAPCIVAAESLGTSVVVERSLAEAASSVVDMMCTWYWLRRPMAAAEGDWFLGEGAAAAAARVDWLVMLSRTTTPGPFEGVLLEILVWTAVPLHQSSGVGRRRSEDRSRFFCVSLVCLNPLTVHQTPEPSTWSGPAAENRAPARERHSV